MNEIDQVEMLKSDVRARAKQHRRLRATRLFVGRFVTVLGLLISWEFLSGRVLDPFFVSSPLRIYAAFLRLLLEDDLILHAQYTVIETLLGFVIGAVLAVLAAFLLSFSRILYEIVEPIIIGLYAIPRVALAPLFIMWFGIGITSKVIIAAIFVFFIVFMNTVTGIRSATPELVNITRLMGARNSDVLLKIVLPSAMPYILAALRMSVPMAMIGAIIGEFISAQKGLGFLISRSTFELSTHASFAGIAVLVVVVALMNTALGYLERYILRWQPQRERLIGAESL